MNDIEKAMALLREGRRSRINPVARDPGQSAGGDPSLRSSVAEFPNAESSTARLPDDRLASTEIDGGSDGASRSHPSGRGERGRFDDDLFADDILDGFGVQDVSAVTTPVALPTDRRRGDDLSDAAAGTDRPEAGGSDSPPCERALPAGEAFKISSEADRPVAGERSSDRNADALTEGGDRLVTLPLKRLAEQGFITPAIVKGRLSEEFRRVKRPILKNIADVSGTGGHRNVIMITSSVAGEGKTYIAINLAMSLAAERERTVLLVDADVIKGSAGRVLGIGDDRPGLTDVLANESLDIADVMLATDVRDLRIVPAGRRDEHTTELLSSTRMSRLIDELAKRYSDRIIVLDCPPILQTNEANVIVDHAGQVIFVVAGEETDQRLVVEAMRRFDEEKSVSVLLNKASGSSAAYRYDYG